MKETLITLKKKYIEKHNAMLTVYSQSNLPETTLAAMRSEMASVLRFIEDLKKIQSDWITKPTEWDNKFTPRKEVSDIDRVNFWTNINEDLLKKLRQAKNN